MDYSDYATFIEPIRHRMVNSIWRIVRDPDDTDDVLQDVLLRIAKKVATIRTHANPTALILRMCINTAIDSCRETRSRTRNLAPASSVETQQANSPSASEQLLWRERQGEVLAAIEKLPRREGESILLLALEELTYPEIAQAMGCRESTVRVLVMKARKRLKAILSGESAGTCPQTAEREA